MTKFISLIIGGAVLLALSACGTIQPPVLDSDSPQLSVMVSDSGYNSADAYTYMLYESNGPRKEAGFVTTDSSANIRAHGADFGGIKSIEFRAENGTLTPASGYGIKKIETSVDGNASVVTVYGDMSYAMTPLEHMVTVVPNGSNEVLVTVTVNDRGGLSENSNTTTTPEIKVVFTGQ